MDDWNEQTASSFVIATARAIVKALVPETLLEGSGQIHYVAFELAKSVCDAAGVGTDSRFRTEHFKAEFVEAQAARIGEIVSSIPAAFHHFSLPTVDGKTIAPFELGPAKFLLVIPTIKDEPAKKLTSAYNKVWVHSRALWEVGRTKAEFPKAEYYLHANLDSLNWIAQKYLSELDFVSPTLEQTLVDALIHSRIVEFGNSRQLKGTPDFQRIDGPLLAGTSDTLMGAEAPSVAVGIGTKILELVIKLLIEAVALFATWLVAEAVAGDSKWILFTGVTAARWIVATIRSAAISGGDKKNDRTNLELAWDMSVAHEHVQGMNVKLLQHLLYRLEERGAGFSVYVYDILDKRAKREAHLPQLPISGPG